MRASLPTLRRAIRQMIASGHVRAWAWTASELDRAQTRRNPVLHRWRRAGGQALPILAFKESRVVSFRPTRPSAWFESSGTTGETSRHHLRSLDLYRASVIAGWKWMLDERGDPEGPAPILSRCGTVAPGCVLGPARTAGGDCATHQPHRGFHFTALMPSAVEKPHSSLSAMLAILMDEFGDGRGLWAMRRGRWEWPRLRDHLRRLEHAPRPAVLFGTAFAWVHFLDWCAVRRTRFHLPRETRVFETGGYKGRSRELSRDELHGRLARCLGLPSSRIGSEYSMCEISSQAWSYRDARGRLLFRFPPWCRARVARPGTSSRAHPGEPGVLEIHDLANVDSCAWIRTGDMAVERGEGFVLIGRLPRAGLKGCSLEFESELKVEG